MKVRTRYEDLRGIFERNVTVEHISELLVSCQASDDTSVARKTMEEKGFDLLGVEDEGYVLGYVEKSSLIDGLCRDQVKCFHPSELVANGTSLIELLSMMRESPRVFVLRRNKVQGIVTRADLQKVPVRMLIFGFVSLLEMHFLRLVRHHYRGDSWQDLLPPGRLNLAQSLFNERQRRNEEIDLVECLQLADKRDLILRIPELRDSLGFETKAAGSKTLTEIQKLRDRIAHPQDITSGSSWAKVIDLVDILQDLVVKCESL